jgi:hypothetical protein
MNYTGDNGNNVAGPINDILNTPGVGSPGPLSAFYGPAITRTLYVWGDPCPNTDPQDPSNCLSYGLDKSSQIHKNCPATPEPPGCTTAVVWEDMAIDGSTSAGYAPHDSSANPLDMRVRFTKSYDAIIYRDLPQQSNSNTKAIIVDRPVTGPANGCAVTGWTPGGAVYGRQVGP